MKIAFVIGTVYVFFALTGCSDQFRPEWHEAAQTACKDRGGYKHGYHRPTSRKSFYVVCNDDATILFENRKNETP